MHTGRREEGGEAWPTARANVERQRRKGVEEEDDEGAARPRFESIRTEERERERENGLPRLIYIVGSHYIQFARSSKIAGIRCIVCRLRVRGCSPGNRIVWRSRV